MSQPSPQLLTVTWSGDRGHFSLLQASLACSRLAALPHTVVVQSEDLPAFATYRRPPVSLRPSSAVLPAEVERRRRQARRWQRLWGRRGATLGGSLARHLGWPRWVRYTGWHTQQLSKLAVAAASEAETVVVLDSDVVVTPHAEPTDFLHPGGIVAFEQWRAVADLRGKVRKWQQTAHRLFDQPFPTSGSLDCYFDTPFVLHTPTVRAMLDWLQARYGKPWWQVLLGQAPRRWSEFACYKCFLRQQVQSPIDWRGTEWIGYLFDASEPARLLREFDLLVEERRCRYITIHSQSSGRKLWRPEDYGAEVLRRVQAAQRLT